jgi:hypothetical protein
MRPRCPEPDLVRGLGPIVGKWIEVVSSGEIRDMNPDVSLEIVNVDNTISGDGAILAGSFDNQYLGKVGATFAGYGLQMTAARSTSSPEARSTCLSSSPARAGR